jgi:hypothetical protein
MRNLALFLAVVLGFTSGAQNIVVNSTAPRNNPMWLVQNVLVGPNLFVYSPLNQFGLPQSTEFRSVGQVYVRQPRVWTG